MTVCVFCSALDDLAPAFQQAAAHTGEMLAARGHRLLYGGRGAGLMGILAQGAGQGGAEVEGIVPECFRGDDFLSPYCTAVTYTATMAERKTVMQQHSDAFLILPGGIGTMDELFDTSVLIGLGQLKKPLAILNVNSCYDALRQLLDDMVQQGFLSEEKRRIYHFVSSPEQALDHFESFYKQ